MNEKRIVIIGAGQAGARTALALRAEGWQDDIVLLGAEQAYPYERPPLSKSVLVKNEDPLKATILTPERSGELAIETRVASPVSRLDVAARRVVLADGDAVAFSHCVIATGTKPRKLPTPGFTQFQSVLALRTADDARRLAPLLRTGASVVLIGGGFIGLEVAASAVARGCRVTVLEAEPHVMTRMVPSAIAARIEARHRAHGVDIRTGVRIDSFEGLADIRRVLLSNGTAIDADVVVVGVGALPQDCIARKANIKCASGIVVDTHAQTSVPGIYAVGDVARHESLWGMPGVRLESWENAELQPKAAARAIMGHAPDPRGAPWFWTDQYDDNLQILGFFGAGDETVFRGDPAGRSWSSFALRDARIVGACLMNAGADRRVVRRLMDEGHAVDRRKLADVGAPLRALLDATQPT